MAKSDPTRRAMVGLTVGSPLASSDAQQSLTDGGRFSIGDRGAQVIARAQALGRECETKNGNCAQCKIAALQDSVDFLPKNGDLFLAGSCLHGGATANGNANCGGFTGSGIVIGHLCGRTRELFGDRGALKLATALIREMAGRFEQAYGSVSCKDVKEPPRTARRWLLGPPVGLRNPGNAVR